MMSRVTLHLIQRSSYGVLLALAIISSSYTQAQTTSRESLLISQTVEITASPSPDISSSDASLPIGVKRQLEGAYRLHPNRRFIGMTWRLWAYKLIRPEALDRSLKKRELKNREVGGLRYGIKEAFGEPPTFWDEDELYRTSAKMLQILNQEGYLQAKVKVEVDSSHVSGWSAIYLVDLGIRWSIDSIVWNTTTSGLPLKKLIGKSYLNTGSPLSIATLQAERSRISKKSGELGFATFNEGFIQFNLDTVRRHGGVDIEVVLRGQRIEGTNTTLPHKSMKIGSIFFDQSDMNRHVRTSVLKHLVTLDEGGGFNPDQFESSYRRLSSLVALKAVELKKDIPYSTSGEFGIVDVTVQLHSAPRYDLALEFDMTRSDTRYGPLGKLTWTDRNATGGGDVLTWTASASVASTQPFSYNSTSIIPNSGEFGFSFSYRTVGLPPKRLKTLPKSTAPHTEWIVRAARESRPEYAKTTLDYRHRIDWIENSNRNSRITIDVLQISYVQLEISNEFNQWLEGQDDPVLKNRFSDYASTGSRLGWTSGWGSLSTSSRKLGGSMGLGLEWSGTLSKQIAPVLGWNISDEGGVTIGEVPLVKYVRVDGSWIIGGSLSLNSDRSWVSRLRFGSAWVGEGTGALPYDRGFIGGGSNGIRGWPVRELGPGTLPADGSVSGVLRGVGDTRIEGAVELRMKWTSLSTIALFADMGNVWIHENGLDNGTSLKSATWSSVALSSGLGIRLDFEFFLIRLDAAIRIHDPTRPLGARWISPNRLAGAIHLGLGHPF